jgi:hypothetical protein
MKLLILQEMQLLQLVMFYSTVRVPLQKFDLII